MTSKKIISFLQTRRARWSFSILALLLVFSTIAELWCNDRPLLVSYQGKLYTPLIHDYSELEFGGDFDVVADYHDPFVQKQISAGSNWALYPLYRYHHSTLNYFDPSTHPAAPSAEHWLGTDDRGRDVFARLVYGLRVSLWFGVLLTAVGLLLGVVMGAYQGYFAGKVDLIGQRLMEIWGAIPELYLLLIFASLFEPSLWLLFILLSVFGWMSLADYMRIEFLRQREIEYVKAAKVMGVSHHRIMFKHILPNTLAPLLSFVPFRVSAAILALTSLDFLGLGVPPEVPSIGELLLQAKNNLDAWWIGVSVFGALVLVMVALTFLGESLRQSMDVRKK